MSSPTAPVNFDRTSDGYRHWELQVKAPLATLRLRVDPDGGLRDDYQLKLNSYDLAVDIELADAVQRLRFEHPEVHAVVVTGGLDRVFCAGANIQMLAGASHHHKVNFCKFTNETRLAIEDASAHSGQVWLAAINGTAAGGGYELALACDEIILVDDRSSAVSLPEVPLLGVLPGTGGLTRVVDKRCVRRDLADLFATKSEGIQAAQALSWGLVDSVAPRTRFEDHVSERASVRAAGSDRPSIGPGAMLGRLTRSVEADCIRYRYVDVRLDRSLGAAHLTVMAPEEPVPATFDGVLAGADQFWTLAACRELEDAVLHLRFNEPEVGTWVLRTSGRRDAVLAADDLMRKHHDHWLAREMVLYWKRTLQRLDLSARTLVALIESGSCFAGTLAELALAADRSFMLDGTSEEGALPAPALVLTDANLGWFPMLNGLTRLQSRFFGHQDIHTEIQADLGAELPARRAAGLGLVTAIPDELDWDEEIRLALEERASFSPDALTALEANLRFVGPETMETKIFARLSAWQNWIFQRPNATGPAGALPRYGTGSRPAFDRTRV